MSKPRLPKHLLCRILGHDWDQDAEDHGYHYCNRCCQDGDEEHPIREWFRTKGFFLYWRWHNFISWFKPCSDCGRRFNRHDDSVEHLPF